MHSNIYIQGTPINEKLPERDLSHPEWKGHLRSQHGYSPFWNADPGEEKLCWSIHHSPGGWSIPVPPTRHLYQKIQGNHDIEYVRFLEKLSS